MSAARSWTRDTLDEPSAWRQPLPDRVIEQIEAVKVPDNLPLVHFRLPEAERSAGTAALAGVREALEIGRGFVILELPARCDTAAARIQAYWLVGQMLGEPFAQNTQGTMLY